MPGRTATMQLLAGSKSCVSPESTFPISSVTVQPSASVVPTITSSLPGQSMPSVPQRLDDLLAHLLGVAEQHHGVVAEEQLVLDAGIAGRHRALRSEEHTSELQSLMRTSY